MFVTPLYVPCVGGLEIFVRQLMRELRSRGHETIVVTSHGGAASTLDDVDGVAIFRLPVHHAIASQDAAEILRVQVEMSQIVERFDPDLVHSHDPGPVLWLYARAARRVRRPIVVTLQNVMTRQVKGSLPVLANLLREADWVTGVSRDVVDDVLTFAPSVATRLSVIHNASAPLETSAAPAPVDPPRLLCLGRLVPQKGFDLAIAAMALLAPRHPAARLVIAGDGSERVRLRSRAVELGVADRVEFTGAVDRERVAELLGESTAVLMPSRFEGFPLVALEAAWAGRPVVAARAPGLQEAVVDGETGVVVDPEDPRALADGVERLLADPDEGRALGSAARALVERKYSLAACASAYESLYRSVSLRPGPD